MRSLFIVSLSCGSLFAITTTQGAQTFPQQNGREISRPPANRYKPLRFEDRDDLVRTRIDDEDLIADHDVVVTAPFRINHDDFPRQRVEMHAFRYAGSHAHRD